MDKKWKEKTVPEKTADIISGVALCIWLIFEIVERANVMKYADIVNYAAVIVICVCQAISLWNKRRALSYVGIGGAIFMTIIAVLQVLLYVA